MFDVIHNERWNEISDCFIAHRRYRETPGCVKNDLNHGNDDYIHYGMHRISQQPCIIHCVHDKLIDILPLIKMSNYKHILIVTQGKYDSCVDAYINSRIPPNVVRIYAVNANVIDCRVIPIPIGVERFFSGGCGVYYELFTHDKKQTRHDNILCQFVSRRENIEDRQKLIDTFKLDDRFVINNVTSVKSYADSIRQHKFVLSPFGNGIDCYRTYEAMYCGAIPIVKNSVLACSMAELPMIIVDDYYTADYDNIIKQYEYIIAHSCTDKLNFSYWFSRIYDDCKLIGRRFND